MDEQKMDALTSKILDVLEWLDITECLTVLTFSTAAFYSQQRKPHVSDNDIAEENKRNLLTALKRFKNKELH